MQSTYQLHWTDVYHILRYLKRACGKGLYTVLSHLDIMGYFDAHWVDDPIDRCSTTGNCTFLGGNLVTWRSKKPKFCCLI